MNFYENSASNESITQKYQDKKNIEAIKVADEEKCINDIVLVRKFGEPEIFVKGKSSNLWRYSDKILIDKFDKGFFNTSHIFGIVPMRSIKTLQFKNEKTLDINIVEIGVFDANLNKNDMLNEDGKIVFKSEGGISEAIDAYFYIAERICGVGGANCIQGMDNVQIQSTGFDNKSMGKQKICRKCGRVMGANSVFCGNCGQKYEEEVQEK